MKQPSRNDFRNNALFRGVFFILGFVFLGLGVLGVIIPGLPTTVFVILAGYCWAKSSKRFHRWLISHKIFGKMITSWQERKAIPRSAKYMAWSMMAISTFVLFFSLPPDKIWIAVIAALMSLAVAIWMAKLPDA